MSADTRHDARLELSAAFDDGEVMQWAIAISYRATAKLPGVIQVAVSVPCGRGDEGAVQLAESALQNAIDVVLSDAHEVSDVDGALARALGNASSARNAGRPSGGRLPVDGDELDIESVVGAEMFGQVQRCLADLVERTLRQGSQVIIIDRLDLLGDYFEAWAVGTGRVEADGVRYGGRKGEPGLWHLLQEVHPLKRRQHWNALRAAVVRQRVEEGRWERLGSGPRAAELFMRRPMD